MLIWVILGLAVAFGAPWPAVVVAATAALHPLWFLIGVAAWVIVVRRRRPGAGPDDEAAFLRGLAAELAAGASLRGAVAAAASRAPALDLGRASRLCAAGCPSEDVGGAVAEALPVNGIATAAAFRLADRTGGSIGAVVEGLAARADAEGRLARERRALTAQARLSAWIVGGMPIVLVVAGLATGLGPDVRHLGPGGTLLVGIGFGLIAAGSLAVWMMMRRTGR